MTTLEKARGPLRGEVTVPGDKSISHRSIMFGALAEGDTTITGFLESADCLSTIDCFRKLGISIDREEDECKNAKKITVHGKIGIGDVIVKNFLGTGTDLIASGSIE